MIPARPFASALSAVALIAGAFFAFVASVGESRAQVPGAACEDAAGIAVLPSPVAPWKGAPLRVLFTAETPIEGELALRESRTGRVEVTQMWGRPESVRQEFRRIRAQ